MWGNICELIINNLCLGGCIWWGVVYLLHTDKAAAQDITGLPHCTRWVAVILAEAENLNKQHAS